MTKEIQTAHHVMALKSTQKKTTGIRNGRPLNEKENI